LLSSVEVEKADEYLSLQDSIYSNLNMNSSKFHLCGRWRFAARAFIDSELSYEPMFAIEFLPKISLKSSRVDNKKKLKSDWCHTKVSIFLYTFR